MKKAAKVCIWIGMVLQCFLIYPVIIGIFALKKIDNARSVTELKNWAIATIFLCSPIGGIFMLNITESELRINANGKVELLTYTKEFSGFDDVPFFSEKAKKVLRIISLSVLLIILAVSVFLIYASIYEKITIGNDYQYCQDFHTKIIALCCIQLLVSTICIIIWEVNAKRQYLYLFITSLISLINATSLFVYYGINWCVRDLGSYMTDVVIVFILCNFLFGIVITIFYFIIFQNEKKTRKIKVMIDVPVNNLEVELNEVQSLLEKSVITPEEYNDIRAKIINKYYN